MILKSMAFLKGSGMPEMFRTTEILFSRPEMFRTTEILFSRPEMFRTTEILFSRPELRTSVALVTDGRFSGATDKGASMLRGRG